MPFRLMGVIRRAIATPVVMAIVPLYQKLDSQCLDPANRISIVEGIDRDQTLWKGGPRAAK